jgi:hypothetical protein
MMIVGFDTGFDTGFGKGFGKLNPSQPAGVD